MGGRRRAARSTAALRALGAGRCAISPLRPSLVLALSAAVAGLAPTASAESDEPVVAPEVVIEDTSEDVRPEDDSVSVEVIEVDDHAPGATVADLLEQVEGVRVRRLGGLGSFATVSIRGSTAAQVLVLRDGVELGSAAGAEVNLSELDLAGIERVEVYRGPSPAHFGTGGLGGVINLVSREAARARTRVELGLGAFMPGHLDALRVLSSTARRAVAAQTGGRAGPVDLSASARLDATEGDFTYLDDNGTLWQQDDDRFARRENNDATQGDFRVTAAADLPSRLRLTVDEAVSVRSQGVAGYGAFTAEEARLRTGQSLTQARLERPRTGRCPRLQLGLSARTRRDEWSDEAGEIGVGREHRDDFTLDLEGRGRAGWVLPSSRASLWVQAELRHQRLRSRNLLGAGGEWGWERTSGAVGTWVTWPLAGGVVELSPQLRLELSGDSPVDGAGPTIAGGGHPEAVTRLFVSSELGVTARPRRWLRLRASGGLTQRPPAFLELFGNQGAVVGNPELRPESGWSVDGGVELAARRRRAIERAGLELTGFFRSVEDLIQLVPNSQVTFVASNAGAATVAGLEASGVLRVDWGTAARSRLPGWVLVRSGLTYLDAVDRSRTFVYLEGRQLPLRPRLELFARLEAGWGPIVAAYELDYTSGNFLDPYNAFSVPHRLFHSAELSVDLRRWRGPTITVLARNLTDRIVEVVPVEGHGELRRPVADVAGFPLPGLTVFLNLRWDLDALAR